MNMNNDALTAAWRRLDAWQPTSPETIATLEREAAAADHMSALVSHILTALLYVTIGGGLLMSAVATFLFSADVISEGMKNNLLPAGLLVSIVGGATVYTVRFCAALARVSGDGLAAASTVERHKVLANREQLEDIQAFFARVRPAQQSSVQKVRAVLANTDLSAPDAAEILVLIREVEDAQYRVTMRASLAGEPAMAGH